MRFVRQSNSPTELSLFGRSHSSSKESIPTLNGIESPRYFVKGKSGYRNILPRFPTRVMNRQYGYSSRYFSHADLLQGIMPWLFSSSPGFRAQHQKEMLSSGYRLSCIPDVQHYVHGAPRAPGPDRPSRPVQAGEPGPHVGPLVTAFMAGKTATRVLTFHPPDLTLLVYQDNAGAG